MKLLLVLLLTLSSAYAKTVTIMSYNVQNLFDTIHDEGKEDYAYLPLALKEKSPAIQSYCKSLAKESWQKSCLFTDWNDEVLRNKILNLSRVIKSYRKGAGADILVLQEVENKKVLQMLVDLGLKNMGYKYISLIEGPDARGIDVGVISKLPIVNEKLHLVNLEGMAKATRGILQVDIKVNKKIITILGNHWPSQHNPSEARVEAAKVMLEAARNSDADLIVGAGDFNTLDNEVPNGIKDVVLPNFVDAEKAALSRPFKTLFAGTHWYAGHFSSLDKMFIFKRLYGAKVMYRSFRIHAMKFMFGEKIWTDRDTGEITLYPLVPMSYNFNKKTGFSDHLPIAMKFIL